MILFFFLALNVQANKKISILVECLTSFEHWADEKGLIEPSSGDLKVLLNEYFKKKENIAENLEYYSAVSKACSLFSLELAIIRATNYQDIKIALYIDGLKASLDDVFTYISSQFGFEEKRRSSCPF